MLTKETTATPHFIRKLPQTKRMKKIYNYFTFTAPNQHRQLKLAMRGLLQGRQFGLCT